MDLEFLDFGKRFTNNEQHQNLLHIYGLLPLWVAINVVKTNLCIVLLIFDIWALLPSSLSTPSSLLASFLIYPQIIKLQQTFLGNQ